MSARDLAAPERQSMTMKWSPFPSVLVVLVAVSTFAVSMPAAAASGAFTVPTTLDDVLSPSSAPSLDLATGDPSTWIDAQDGIDSQWSGESAAGREAPRRIWALFASAAVPGLGETLTGRWLRGSALIAADAVVWSVRIDKNDEGDELEQDYKDFADLHWSEEEWSKAIGGDPDSGIDENFDLWRERVGAEDATSIDDIALYVSREEDLREWYENAGKWDVFSWGWREFWDAEWNRNIEYNAVITRNGVYAPNPYMPPLDEGDPDPRDRWFDRSDALRTPLRDEYVGIRNASNDAFETRDQMTTILLLTRVFSVLQMAYLEGFVGGRFDAPVPADHGMTSRGLGVTKFGPTGTGLAWKVTY